MKILRNSREFQFRNSRISSCIFIRNSKILDFGILEFLGFLGLRGIFYLKEF